MAEMKETEDFEDKAFGFLVKVHEFTGGKESGATHMDKVGNELGFEPAMKVAVTDYLYREGLIDYPGIGGEISITASGIARVERRRP